MRYLLLIIFGFIINFSYGISNIGVTSLLYNESDASLAFANMGVKLPASINVRPEILHSINMYLPIYSNRLLKQINNESGLEFSVTNADSELHMWQLLTPDLLRTIKNTNDILPVESLNESNVETKVVSDKKFILLGFIDNIKETEQHSKVNNNLVIIYNLDIIINYRLVDIDTHKVVSTFIGAGHGGISRVVSNENFEYHQSIDNVVNDMLNSLAQNVDHALQIRQADFISTKRLPPPPKLITVEPITKNTSKK